MSKAYFLPYQQRWIQDESAMKLAEKSRRVGFTYASSYRHVQKCLRKPKGFTQWVSSRDLLTAKEYVTEYAAKWATLANVVATGLNGDDVEVIDETKGIHGFKVEFETGCRIMSLSSTPEAFAGKGGDVYLDEVDLHENAGDLIDMALPCTTWGGQFEAVSAYAVDGSCATPWATIVEDAKGENTQGFSLHRVTIDDAIADGLVERINEVAKTNWTREEWRAQMKAKCRTREAWESQYLCIVQDAAGAVLAYELIRPCEDPRCNDGIDVIPNGLTSHFVGPLYYGMDIGRTHDLSVIWLLERCGGIYVSRSVYSMRDMFFRDQKQQLYKFIKLPGLNRGGIDRNGIGMNLAEDATLDHGPKGMGVDLTREAEIEMALNLKTAFEDQIIRIPRDETIRSELHKASKATTATGRMSIKAGRDGHGHADYFWALALAYNAATNNGAAGWFAPEQIAAPPAGNTESQILYDNGRSEKDPILSCL